LTKYKTAGVTISTTCIYIPDVYSDVASENLEYKKYGIKDRTGFDYAKFISIKR